MSRGRNNKSRASRLQEVSRFFMREGDVYDAIRRLARRLDEEGLPYFRQRLVGRGYVPAFPNASKTFRDTETGVRIEIVTTGDYPGDGQPKPVRFPDPEAVAVSGEGFRFVDLQTLVELKLASGLSAPHRGRDLVDIQDLIFHAKLPLDLAERLDPSVREEYRRLWQLAQSIPPPE